MNQLAEEVKAAPEQPKKQAKALKQKVGKKMKTKGIVQNVNDFDLDHISFNQQQSVLVAPSGGYQTNEPLLEQSSM